MTKTKTEKKSVAKENVKEPTYSLYIKINDVVTETKTDDIAEAILSAKPEFPKTPLTIRVTKGDKTLDRFIQLPMAKKLFSNKLTMESFIKNLLF